MNFQKNVTQQTPEINLIPFIDVLLVILIFLMVTTTYSRFSELQISLPVASAESTPQRAEQIVVMIDASGNVAINNKIVSYSNPIQFAQELTKYAGTDTQSNKPVVIISADSNARHQSIVNILESARIAGLDRLTFATVKPQ